MKSVGAIAEFSEADFDALLAWLMLAGGQVVWFTLDRRLGWLHLVAAAVTVLGFVVFVAVVPLSEMFGYIGQLRSMTSGRASYTMEFSHYEPVPKNVADEVIAEVAKARAAKQA